MIALERKPLQFYFALPRVIAMLCRGNAQRSETNGFEAFLVGLWIYAIHYLYFASVFIPKLPTRWLLPLLLIVLVIGVWFFWIVLTYMNSLIIRLLRLFGLFQTVPTRRVQSIIWGLVTTIMAGEVLKNHPWLWQLSLFWLLAVFLNLLASLALSYSDAARGFDE
jgi:hypothetical protein